jgi:hypothetical protein
VLSSYFSAVKFAGLKRTTMLMGKILRTRGRADPMASW